MIARVHDVDLHVRVAQVDLHALGPGRDRGLGRGVRGFAGRRQASRHRRHEHDPTVARDDLGEQRQREADRREVVDLHHALDDRRRRAREPCGASGCRRCSRARRCRRALPKPASANASSASRSERSTVHACESGACARHRASTSCSLSSRRAQIPTVAPRRANPSAETGADPRRRAGHEHVLAVQVVRHGREASLGAPCRSRRSRYCSPAGVAVVTGAAQGIGAAVAGDVRALRGGRRDLRPRCRRPRAHGRRDRSHRSHTRPRACSTCATATRCEPGSSRSNDVHVLVNNAGGGFFAAFLDVNDKGQDALVRENFTSVTHFIRACVPKMPDVGDRSSTSRRSRRTVRRPASRSTRR